MWAEPLNAVQNRANWARSYRPEVKLTSAGVGDRLVDGRARQRVRCSQRRSHVSRARDQDAGPYERLASPGRVIDLT